MKKNGKEREPSLFRRLIAVYWEQLKARRAVRCLQRQSWSFDFLALLLVKASRMADGPLSLVITDKAGVSYTLTYDKARSSDAVRTLDDSIFNHLDDDVAVDAFIRSHSTR